ncbi:MAG: serine hydrolase [Desulfobacteraceae bacterium]|nr:serine hydrolase [Desulfobacteraceae bacterium]
MTSVAAAMERAVRESVFPGAVLLASRGADIRFHQAFGVADLGTGEPVTNGTLFDLASLTKPLATTMAVLDLVQQGRLRVEQPLGELLPGVTGTDKAQVTVDDLLRHRSGLPAYHPYYKALMGFPPEERRDRLRNLIVNEPLVYETGRKELYSDLGFILLAWVTEILSGSRLDRHVREKIHAPLGLDRLGFRGVGAPLEKGVAATEDCPWRKRVLKGEVHDDNAWAVGGVEGHAGLFGTAFQVWMLLKEILDGVSFKATRVIDGALIRRFAARKPGYERAAGFDTPSGTHSSAGRFFSAASLGHLGFTGTSFWMDPVASIIVVLLTNRVHPVRSNEKIRKFRPEIHDLVMEMLLEKE